MQIVIFYLGNLGTRAIFLLLPIWRFIKKTKWKKEDYLLSLIFLLFLISSIFPLLFLQRGTVWNSIQFWYYSLIFADVLALVFFIELSKRWKKSQRLVILILLILLSIPSFLQTIANRWQNFKRIPENEVELLANLNADEKILICPDNSWWYRHSIVNSLTPAEIYLADPGQISLLNLNLADFENFEQLFEDENLSSLEKLTREEGIDYILCNNSDFVEFVKKLNWQEQNFKDWSFFSAENVSK
jgi:hypothetical protein